MTPTPTQSATEAMATAMQLRVRGCDKLLCMPGVNMEHCLCAGAARAALTALCALHPGIGAVLDGGAVVVPREATEAMLEAGEALDRPAAEFSGYGTEFASCDQHYRAMIAASPYAPAAVEAEGAK